MPGVVDLWLSYDTGQHNSTYQHILRDSMQQEMKHIDLGPLPTGLSYTSIELGT